jgi:hypothetical protein
VPHAATQKRQAGWRDRIKARRGTRYAYQAGVFLLGLLVILACLGLWTILPAPVAIPPMLLGVWIWSTEFPFADGLLDWLRDKGQSARDYAKRHPVRFGVMAVASFLLAVAAYSAFFQVS